MSDPDQRPPRSLGNQATGADLDSAAVHAVRSIGEKSTAGDIGSSVSDLKDELSGFAGETDDVVDLETRYEFRGELGRGGMGEVLLALDRRLNRQVAIKRLKEDLENSRRASQRFLVEAQSIAALDHFNIVQIFDYGRAIDGPFIVMEYVSGGTLADRLAAEPIEQSVAVDLVDQLCQALTVTHSRGVIHRDIKPSNVLMTTDGVPKLTDFGLARQESSDEGQTRAGTLLGTLDYMPPEQRKDATSADVRSDLWSLGATLYQMVTGNSPRVIVLEEVPEALRTVLGTVLKLDPGDRYQTAEEFRSALQLAQTGAPSKGATGLSNGECALCAHVSIGDQKFCQECGGSLEVDCLGCQRPIEVWRAFCSSCGANISEILKNERTTLERQKRTIEDLRQGFRFADAITALEPLQVTRHPLLHPFSEWATHKTEQIGQELTKWEAERNTLLETARVSFRERADRDTVQLLEQIPEPLRDASVSDLLEQAQSRIDETRTLKQLIDKAIAAKRMNGLLPHAERYAELSPTDGNALRLVTRLRQRQVRKQTTMLEEAKRRIAELANDLRYLEALALLDTVAKRIIADDGDAQAWVRTTREDLLKKSEPLRRQWVEMEETAAAAFSAGDYDRVIELLEQVPKLARQARSSRNLKEAAIRKTRVEELRLEISREETSEDCSMLALLVEEYLRLKPNDETMSAVQYRVDKWLTNLEQQKRKKHKQQRVRAKKTRRSRPPRWMTSVWFWSGLAGMVVLIVAVVVLGDRLRFETTASESSAAGSPSPTEVASLSDMLESDILETEEFQLDLALPPAEALRKLIGMKEATSHTLKEGETLEFRVAYLTSAGFNGQATLLFTHGSSQITGNRVRLNAQTGSISYRATERDGPGQMSVRIHATLTPSASSKYKKLGTIRASTLLTLTIEEVNQAPKLALARTRSEGIEVVAGSTFQANLGGAVDMDYPRNTLTYNIEGALPSGARLDPNSGVFTWSPTLDQIGSSYVFRIRVSDDGTPPLEDTATLSMRVVRTLAPRPKENEPPSRNARRIRPNVDIRDSAVLQGLPGLRPGIIGQP